MDSGVGCIQPNPYLFNIENRRKRKARLAHEVGAGARCRKCGDKCPGFELHFWRKICMNCRCGKDDHEVEEEDEDIGRIVIGKLFERPLRTKEEELAYSYGTDLHIVDSKTGVAKKLTFDWVPPGVEKSLASRYMEQLPLDKRPVAGSEAAKNRRKQLEVQLPLYDMDEAQRSVNLPSEELQSFQAFLHRVRTQVAGQGHIQEVVPFVPVGYSQPLVADPFPGFAEGLTLPKQSFPEEIVGASKPDIVSADNSAVDVLHAREGGSSNYQTYSRSDPTRIHSGKDSDASVSDGNVNDKIHSGDETPSYQTLPRDDSSTGYQTFSKSDPTRIFSPGAEKLSTFKKVGIPELSSNLNELSQRIRSEASRAHPLHPPAEQGGAGIVFRTSVGVQVDDGGLTECMETLNVQSQGRCNASQMTESAYLPKHEEETSSLPEKQAGMFGKHDAACQKEYTPSCPMPTEHSQTVVGQATPDHASGIIGLQDALQNNMTADSQPTFPVQENRNERLNYEQALPLKEHSVPLAVSEAQQSRTQQRETFPVLETTTVSRHVTAAGIADTVPSQQTAKLIQQMNQHGYVGIPPVRSASSENHSTLPDQSSCMIPGALPQAVSVDTFLMPAEAHRERLAGNSSLASGVSVNVLLPHESQVLSAKGKTPVSPSKSQFLCQKCGLTLEAGDVAVICERAGPNKFWHPACFVCDTCKELLADLIYFYKDGKVFCGRHYAQAAEIPRCKACDELIFGNSWTRADGYDWHIQHFCCFVCDTALAGSRYVPDKNGFPYCMSCYMSVLAKMCETCEERISPEERRCGHRGYYYHATPDCFRCYYCHTSLIGQKFKMSKNWVFCSQACITESASALAQNTNPKIRDEIA